MKYKIVKITYIIISLVILALLCSLTRCNTSIVTFNDCSYKVQITILILLVINILLMIAYKIWNRYCYSYTSYVYNDSIVNIENGINGINGINSINGINEISNEVLDEGLIV